MENKFAKPLKSTILLLDMDEVLVDFVGGALRVHGLTRADILPHWEPGQWSIVPPMAAVLGDGFNDDQFWAKINNCGWQFWSNLRPHAWFYDLMRLVERVFEDRWFIVSSPSRCPSSRVGKIKWLKQRFGERFDRYLLTPHKHLLAGPGKLLVDDRESNCERFIKYGGDAIVFPSHHNSLHHVENSLTYLEGLLCS